ncbi:MAG TPA: diguanylate cyclase, partial [Solirubrobacter sp.]|nr:diguanylate cyclase [Solirubrobacter sp.]
MVALVVIAASAGIAALHMRADERRTRYELLVELESSANRVDALESEANAERRVPLGVQAELKTLLTGMRADLEHLEDRGSSRSTALLQMLTDYEPLIEEELALLRARDFERAAAVDDAVNFDRVRDGLRHSAEYNHDLAERSDRMSWIGTVVVTLALVIGLTTLLALLDRSGRRRQREDDLQRLAFQDPLTGLPNRSLFEERIAETLDAGDPAVVAFLDLDDFKQVNDSLGHAAGDELLKVCADRLRHALRAGDTVARLGGDEFAILALGAHDPQILVDRLFAVLADPVVLEGKRLHLRASVGIASTDTGTDLLRNADLAMYAAKGTGTNRCAVFTADMHVNALARLDRREQLERAIENEELILHYQPIVDLDLGRVTGFEALVRWQHP